MLPPPSVRHVLDDPRLTPALALCREVLSLGEQGLREGGTDSDWPARVSERAQALLELRRVERPLILSQTANGEAPPAHALELLDAMRWLDRLAYHVVRIVSHLGEGEAVDTGGAGDAVLGEIGG
jgi:phosphate:Na+ symporter